MNTNIQTKLNLNDNESIQIDLDEKVMFRDDQLFSELVHDVLRSSDQNCMDKLQDLEKMCNQYEHITILVKEATNYWQINV